MFEAVTPATERRPPHASSFSSSASFSSTVGRSGGSKSQGQSEALKSQTKHHPPSTSDVPPPYYDEDNEDDGGDDDGLDWFWGDEDDDVEGVTGRDGFLYYGDEEDVDRLYHDFVPVQGFASGGGKAAVRATAAAAVGVAAGEVRRPTFDAEAEVDQSALRAAWLNKRVQSFAGVMRASLSRVGCVATEDDLTAECATLIDRLKRFVAEGGGKEGEDAPCVM